MGCNWQESQVQQVGAAVSWSGCWTLIASGGGGGGGGERKKEMMEKKVAGH